MRRAETGDLPSVNCFVLRFRPRATENTELLWFGEAGST